MKTFYMHSYKLFGVVSIILLLFIFSFSAEAAQASTLTALEQQQLAALSLQLNSLSKLLEILKISLLSSASAQTASTTAPTYIRADWYTSWPDYRDNRVGQQIIFQYPGDSSSKTTKFRFYQKRPADSSFLLVGEFSGFDSTSCTANGTRVYVGEWGLIGAPWTSCQSWAITRNSVTASSYSIGEYSYYVTAVDSTGREGAPSATVKQIFFEPVTILAPTVAQSPVLSVPTFQWSVGSGWPPNISGMSPLLFTIAIFDSLTATNPFWTTNIDGVSSPGTNSKVYSGPVLDPLKKYRLTIYGWGSQSSAGSTGPSYMALPNAVTDFSVGSTADTQAPSVPTGLVASVVSSYQINLSWTASTDNVGVTGYKIYRNNVHIASSTTISYSDTGLSPSTSYSYTVVAYDAAGNVSAQSSSVSATTPTSTTLTVPAKPSIFTAYASGSNVSLYWEGNYPYPTPESEAKVYRRLQGSGSWTQIYSKSYNPAYINYDRYTDAGLANVIYEYKINFCNSGGCSVDSNTVTVTVGGGTTTTISAPISYWKFDGNGNNDVAGGPSAFTVGSAIFNSSGGKSGGYLYIPTGADWAKIPYNSMFDLPGPFTIEFWFRQRTNRSFLQDLVYKGNGINNYNFKIFRQLWDQNNFGPVMMGSTALNTGFWSSPTNSNQLSHGSWHHVAYTRSSSEADSYLDGALLYSLNFAQYPEYSGPVKTPAVDIIIGDSAVDTDIDELKIYNRALGASEVSQDAGITATALPPPPPPTSPLTTATTTTLTALSPSTTPLPPTTATIATTTVTTTGVPAAPSNFNASVSGQNVTLTWNDNSTNEAGFETYRRPTGGSYSSWILLPLSYTVNNTAVGSYTDNNISTGSYDYTISACNSYGCSSGIFVYGVNVGTISAPAATTTTTTITPTTLTPTSPAIDTTPPAGIFNLTVSGATSNSISLNWTAPGDDGNSGTASSYLVRYATSQIFSENMWQSSTPVTSGIPLPQLAGTSQSMTVFGLQPGTVYYFALKTTDKAGNISPLSGSPWGMTQASSSYSVYSYTAPSRATFIPGQQQIQAPPPFIREQTAVEITVLDSTDQPVPNIGIHIFKENFSANFGGTTDTKGLFQVSVPQGLYLAEVFSPVNRFDLVRPVPFIFIVSKEETKKITLRFLPAVKIVTGTVLFPDGKPVSNAEVIAYSTITKQWIGAVVDVNGKYELKLSGGIWQLGVRPKEEGKAKWTWQGPIEEVNFQDNSQQESKALNFTIPFANSNLSVKTVDEKGGVITQAGVVVDTMSAARAYESKVQAQFRKSEERGIAEFSLEGGSYYLRGFVSQESGYLNPAEEVVVLAAGERKEVTLIFKKREVALTVNISGIVKLSTGVKSNAFIWAWSEKGRFAQTRADEEGKFILQVARDDRWHIGAGNELDGAPYKSTEITVVVEKSPVVIEMALVRIKEEVLPPPVIVTQQNTQSLVAQSQDGAKVELQANAVSTAGAVTVEVKPTVEAPSQAGARVVSTVYDVEVKDAKGQKVKELQNEVEISLPYGEKDLKAQGVKEDQITPSFFDESVGSWVKVDKYTIDKKNKVVIAKVKHLTRFALVAAADVTPPLPPTNVFPVAQKDGATKLTWKNPTKDFSNAKLYRSEKKGELGAVISAEASGAEYTDSDTIEGRTYYYTVRAVDPAGNESANVVQAVVKAIATGVKSKAGAVNIQAGVGINRNLSLRDKGEDVKLLQKFLCNAKFYPECLITGVLGALTRQAVISFQEYYGSEILVPAGLSKGNGFVGPGTRKKLNELLGKLKNY